MQVHRKPVLGLVMAIASCAGVSASLVMACGGEVSPSGAQQGGTTTAPVDPCAGQSSGGAYSCQESERRKGLTAAYDALHGRAFRVKEIQIGGAPFGEAPDNYRERMIGEDMKFCFGNQDEVTVCECAQLLVASVDDIKTGGHPTDNCVGPVACRKGTFTFTATGELRLDVPGSVLTWAVGTKTTEEAGAVGVRPEGTYVDSLVGLGNALLEPAAACP